MAPESMVPAKGEPTTEGLFTAWPSVVVKDDDDAPPEASSQPSAALAPPVTLPPLDMTEAAEPTSTTRWWIPALALLLLGGGGGAFWWSQHKSSKLPPKAPLRAKVVTPPRTKAAPAPRKNTKAPEPQTTIDASANTPDAHSIEPRPITRRKTRTHRPKSRTRRRALRRRVKPRPRVAVLPRPRPQQPSGPVGCAVLPSLPCVKVTIQPSSIKAKLRITRGKARIREGRGGTCICFAASRTVQVHVEALLFRPCTVKLSHRSLYQKWTLQRTNPDELEGGQDDYCK